ncbi:beta/gamma crystallin domain-containing protein 1 isoform X2 [Pleuronectes platessa]|uniref:beta/gamma crystallin domain-containing protein 1 isoform X2 n=1 Tax=Pleuronectes platessa TaxID=8262 RepID=UPI00232A3A8F|nr:beta/gamma crystallin domain-containing protein 1 isoform X2 [Pleuronectes platessa]
MFNTYIKSLNDMVFSTSESPEEQPSTGVLGRIGSWLSPWKAKGQKSPTEDDPPTGDQACWSGEGEESEESVRPWAGEQQWQEEEKKDQSSGPNPLGLSRDSFLCERRDATQSARRHDSAGADRAHTQRQAQAQAGRRLHVYLEETSVFHHGQVATQEVVRTKVTESLQIPQKTKSSPSFDLTNGPTSTSAESRGTRVRPAAEAQSYYSDPVGVPPKSHKDPELEPELDQEQTEADSMGRKNAAKRRQRKNSQGDGVSSPQEKMPPSAQPFPEGSLSSDKSVTSPQGKSPSTHMGEPSESSSPSPNLISKDLPKGGENKTSCSDSDKQLDDFQDSNSVVADTLVWAVDGDADMEDDSSLYKVERKTETPESKRRSMKVSRSEVKLFRKHVPLEPAQSPAGDVQDYKSKLKNDRGEEKEKPKPETNARLQDLKKTAEEPKPVVGRITDKISLFEHQQGGEGFKKTFQTPRSADVSPVRIATDKLKAIPELSFPRSRSAERNATVKPNARPLVGEKPMTIKERVRNLTEASSSEAKPAVPQKPTMTGMSKKSTSSVAAAAIELPEQDSQGKLDVKTAKSEITIKPDGRDTTSVGVNISIPKDQPTDSKKTDAVTCKQGDQGVKPKSFESDISAKVTADSSETAGDISQLPKGPSRTGSRSKRRKSRDPKSPLSPNSENRSTPGEPTSSLSPNSENRSTPGEPTSSLSPNSDNRSTSREPTITISPKSDNRSTPRETTTPISPNSENKSTPREPTSSLSPNSEKRSTPKEPTTTTSPNSGNKSTPREPTTTISPNGDNRSTHKEPRSPISLEGENKSTPREPTAPIGPKSENQPTRKTEVREQVDNKVVSAAKKLTANEGNTSEKPSLSDAKQKAFKEEADVSAKLEKKFDSFIKKNVDKPANAQKGFPDPSVNKDEPDAPARNRGTRKPIDKDPVISPRKEGKAGGLVFTQEREKASKGSGENSAPSPSPSADQPPSTEQAPPVENLKSDKECSVQHDSRSKEKVRPPGQRDKGQKSQPQDKSTDVIKPTGSEDAERQEKSGREKANQTEKKDKDKTQQLRHSDSKTAGGQGDSGKEGTAAKGDGTKIAERKEEHIKDRTKQEAEKPEPASQSSVTTSGSSEDHKGPRAATTQPEKVVQTNEAESRTKPDKGSLRGAIETTVQTESSGTEVCPVAIAAEPQPNSVLVEKSKHSPDDSHTDRANDVEFSSSEPNSKATAAAEEVSVKASNYPPARKNVQTGNISVSKPKRSPRAGQDDRKNTVKAEPSEEKISGDVAKLVPSSTRMSTEEKAQRRPDGGALKPTVHETERTAEETSRPLPKERPLVPNGDITSHSPILTVKKEAPSSPEADKLTPGSPQRLPMKKLHLPRGLSRDDATSQQDAPSSWLDVDFPKRRLKVSEPKLSSSGSESNLLDNDLDDDDFVEKIKKLCAPFSFPPRKHTQLRPPQPLFAMPAIKEARFEKTFDPDEFKFGLRKKDNFKLELPSMLAKHKKTEEKSVVKPARASFADRSLLLSSLDNDTRLREKTPVKDEDDGKEEKDNKIKVKSRLEGSCVLNSLTSSSFRGKRNGAQAQADASSSGEVSPSSPPQLSPPPLPSPTAQAPVKDTLAKPSSALSGREEAQAAEAVVNDSGPPLPSFNDIKLPDYLEKFLQREPAKPVQSTQGQEEVNRKVIEKMPTVVPGGEADVAVKPGPLLPEAVPPRFPGIPPNTHPALPERPLAPPHEKPAHHIRVAKGFHKRPGKMVLFEKPEFSGQAYEIHRDVADATALQLSPLISVKVVRGCWVLYEKPDFQGRTIALEEGGIELTNMWAEPASETEPQNLPPMLIGSVRLAVWDYSIPHIDLFTEPEGHGRVTPYHDDTIETGSFGVPLSTASIQVHSGVWLLFSDPGFQGMLAVLETGVYPFPEAWGFPSPFVGSLRPLRMGTFKVENPNEVKAVVYEQPGFEGSFLEIDSDVFSFSEDDGDVDAENLDTSRLKAVGSLKIIGGLWVGYSQPGFEGQQHILEEGEYLDCSEWGGLEQLLSIRPILADFLSPHLKMFSDRDFGKLGVNIDLTVPVINMDDTGYGLKTQSIDVVGGVWVVFEEPGFCGESYILEKGLYGSPEDWGGLQPRVASAMPVILDDFENAAKFKVQLYSDPGFQGSVVALEDGAASLQDGFSVASCKVVAGNWVAFEGEAFTGRMYVLEIGSYPDLRSMGCAGGCSSILSLQTVGFEFSLPSITLFERCGLRGKRLVLTDGCVNLQLAGGCSRVQSVLVEGGMWILYEGINYQGAQILLKPDEIHDWRKLSSWNKIGSLRPLLQKQVHFRVRNRQSGLMMSVTGDLDEVKLLRIQETEETGGFEQIWIHQNGHLHCKLLEECSLGPSGSLTMAGSRVGLTQEAGDHVHLWSITPDGFIRYTPSSNLVLEVKGGHNYDKNQLILNTLDANKPQQRWDVEII